jgi:spermidine synthase
MGKFLKQNLLLISVFITGACVLIIEVVAVRALSPHYGNTIFTVSSVISVILAALSIGYYAGGKFADRHPSLQWFFGIILVSGLVVLAIHFLGIIILPILSVSLSLASGPLISSLLLFLVPALLLGTLSPYAIKLQSVQVPEQGVGSVSGKIFFWSTLGSIIGSLLAGFVLIPNFGIDYIFISTGVALFLLGLIPLAIFGFDKKRLIKSVLVVLVLTGITFFAIQQIKGGALYSKDGIYEKITIYDSTQGSRPIRVFQQDRSASGAMFLDSDDPTDLVYEYTKYYSLYKIFKPDVQNALVIGGGAYSIPKALLAELPNTTIDVSEIEPSLFYLSKQYFNVENNPNLHNYTEDGRRLLRDSNKKYDLIFSDVYYSLFSIPAHFTTQEFFTIAKEKLSSDGVFIANLIGDLSRQQPSLIFAEIKTFQNVFPNSYFFAVETLERTDSQNIIFVGYNSNKKVDLKTPSILQNPNPIISKLWTKIINLERYNLSPYPVLTDNYSPVEYLTAEVLQRTFGEKPFIDGNEMLAVIDQQLRYGPRYMGSPGHKSVQEFLIAEMQEQTNEVKTQSWSYKATDGNTYKLTNIIGRLYPTQDRRIVLATHYDSKKFADKDWSKKDQPVPGANDSASGVAVLVELARILGNSHVIPNVGVDFVFFDGEEGDINQGSDYSKWQPLGSTYFAEHLNEIYGNNKPVSALVLDMICEKNLRIYKEQSSVQNAKAQVDSFWTIARKVNSGVFRDEVGQSVQDDHTPLNQVGVPSFLLIDFEYPPYHTTGDTLDKCSAESLKTIARAVFDYAYSNH